MPPVAKNTVCLLAEWNVPCRSHAFLPIAAMSGLTHRV